MSTVKHRTAISLRQNLKPPNWGVHDVSYFTYVVFQDNTRTGIVGLGSKM